MKNKPAEAISWEYPSFLFAIYLSICLLVIFFPGIASPQLRVRYTIIIFLFLRAKIIVAQQAVVNTGYRQFFFEMLYKMAIDENYPCMHHRKASKSALSIFEAFL